MVISMDMGSSSTLTLVVNTKVNGRMILLYRYIASRERRLSRAGEDFKLEDTEFDAFDRTFKAHRKRRGLSLLQQSNNESPDPTHHTYHSNPILASTFSSGPHACSDEFGPLWKAQNAREAIMIYRKDTKKQSAIFWRSKQCIKLKAPEGYDNEAERNRVYLKKALEFIFSQPQTFFILTYNRILYFFSNPGLEISIISLLFFISTIITLNNKKVRILVLLILAYVSPYFLVAPTWYRYRYPIEPLVLILSSYLPVLAFSKLYVLYRKP